MMDKGELINKLDIATQTARSWADEGWKITFGPNKVDISSLKAAEEAPDSFVYHDEALSYWRDVDEMGQECAKQGEKARTALEKDDYQGAANAAYFAMFIEQRINKDTPTWGQISTELHACCQL